jgi:isochorismate synthase
MLHHNGFCFFSEPQSQKIVLCVNDELGNEDKTDFMMAPFNSEQEIIRFEKPSMIHLDDLDSAEMLTSLDWAKLEKPVLNSTEVSRGEYTAQISFAQQAFTNTSFTKVIVARNKLVALKNSFNPIQIFRKLVEEQSLNYSYLFYSPKTGIWLGSTPELLLEQKHSSIQTMSLAGTRKNSSSEWTNKEIEEQHIVTHFIESELLKLNAQAINIQPQRIVQSAHIQHLCHDITATMPNNLAPEHIVKALHPTPAVSGYSKSKAIDFIQMHEPFERSYYSGYLGTQNSHSANLFVNLRCMRIGSEFMELFAGAGITVDSNPAEEYKETEAKLQSLLQYI